MFSSLIRTLILFSLIGMAGAMFWYAEKIPASPSSYAGKTDAIIVLTGGSKRLSKGFQLIKERKGNELLITGVGEGVTLAELLAQQDTDSLEEALDARVISLDHAAISTATNATAAKEWMESRRFTTARLVTGNYHMPRSMLEFGTAMPDITFYPEPVFPVKEFKLDSWYTHGNSIKLLFFETIKYLITTMRASEQGAAS